ncbi:MAG: Holliday junction DNA helicase RuvA [Candidatus Levybacteria bacterium RIFCSPHIGHO2_01_FULL_42_15]|nr:MAG: Holliday junction DNA helicase RuvA [Candidatus Levybacteria bacterium RIFCSPHIGHO2_01_FULL_42_15]
MIGSLRGIVILRNDPYIFLEVGGVGYKVLVSGSVFASTKQGEKLALFTYTHVREDALDLYGFPSAEDLELFERLIGVSGVGPKTAMNVFSLNKRDNIIEAIVNADVDFFTSVPRLGRKNAQKIIIELKQKFGSSQELDLSEKDKKQHADVVRALESLGFSPGEAREAIVAVKDKGGTTQELVRLALQYLGKR